MKTASTILGIIGGLLGIVTGYLTQTVGGINSFFEIDNADTKNDWNKKYSQLFPMRIVA